MSVTIDTEDVEQDCADLVAVVMVFVEQHREEHQHGVLHPLPLRICSQGQVLKDSKMQTALYNPNYLSGQKYLSLSCQILVELMTSYRKCER